jgi:hypothetical protein
MGLLQIELRVILSRLDLCKAIADDIRATRLYLSARCCCQLSARRCSSEQQSCRCDSAANGTTYTQSRQASRQALPLCGLQKRCLLASFAFARATLSVRRYSLFRVLTLGRVLIAPVRPHYARDCNLFVSQIRSQNMLYPKEDAIARRERKERKLVYVCRTCENQEEVMDSSIPVYRNVVVHTAEYVQQDFSWMLLALA